MVVCETCGKNVVEVFTVKIDGGYICNDCNEKFQRIMGPHDASGTSVETYRDILTHPENAELLKRKPSSDPRHCLICGKNFGRIPLANSDKPPYCTSDGRFLCKDCVEDCSTIDDAFIVNPKGKIAAHDSEYFRQNLSDCLHPSPCFTFNYSTQKIHIKTALQKKNYYVIQFSDIVSFQTEELPSENKKGFRVNYRYDGTTKQHSRWRTYDYTTYITEKEQNCFCRVPEVQVMLSGNYQIGPSNPQANNSIPISNQVRPQGLQCPRCGQRSCTPIVETNTSGKDFSAGKGCCGFSLLGPIGILCGACGKGKQTTSTTYWMCTNCGNKFRA